MPDPRVVHCKREPYDVLIDRTTQWGNRFRIGPDGTRAEMVEKSCRHAVLSSDLSDRTQR